MIGFLHSPPAPRPEPPPADRFRLGDIWRFPRGKNWQVDAIVGGTRGEIARLRALHNRHSTQWRGTWKTGRDMTNAWERLQSAADLVADLVIYPD
jgi:hypothetical protein